MLLTSKKIAGQISALQFFFWLMFDSHTKADTVKSKPALIAS